MVALIFLWLVFGFIITGVAYVMCQNPKMWFVWLGPLAIVACALNKKGKK